MRKVALIIIYCLCTFIAKSQDISLMHLKGTMPATLLNPGIPLEKRLQISLGAINIFGGTNGPSINDITSKNSDGQRFLDFSKLPSNLDDSHDIFLDYDIRTLDLGLKFGSFALMAGHGFRSTSNIRYTKDLIQLLAFGNANFIGETLDIGPGLDVMSYNEIYLGAQKTAGKFTIGLKAKMLYGASSVSTESSEIQFTTNAEYYQLQFKNDYLIRSSSLLRYNSLDSITLNYSNFTFDNLFYNNRGFAVDLGINFQVTDQLNIHASAADLGSITWDFFPRKYSSKGTFAFEGVDLVDYLSDSTLSVKDTLLDLIDITSDIEQYSTTLNSTFSLGGTYKYNKWSLNALYQMRNRFGFRNHNMSLSVMRQISIFDIAVQYSLSKNNFSGLGIYGKIKLGPFAAYLATDNVLGVFRPLDAKSASVRLGTTLMF
jgi:hypothetical protein